MVEPPKSGYWKCLAVFLIRTVFPASGDFSLCIILFLSSVKPIGIILLVSFFFQSYTIYNPPAVSAESPLPDPIILVDGGVDVKTGGPAPYAP